MCPVFGGPSDRRPFSGLKSVKSGESVASSGRRQCESRPGSNTESRTRHSGAQAAPSPDGGHDAEVGTRGGCCRGNRQGLHRRVGGGGAAPRARGPGRAGEVRPGQPGHGPERLLAAAHRARHVRRLASALGGAASPGVGRPPAGAVGGAPRPGAPHKGAEAGPGAGRPAQRARAPGRGRPRRVHATASSNPARTKSLRKLPGGQLLIGTGGNPRRLFDLIDSAEIEQRAWAVTTSTDRLEAEAEAWAEELTARGKWPPTEDEEP